MSWSILYVALALPVSACMVASPVQAGILPLKRSLAAGYTALPGYPGSKYSVAMTEPDTPHPVSLSDQELLADGESIAVVDDLPDITDLLVHFLQKRGLAAVGVSSAAELRQLLAGGKVALTLLDIGLPDADGAALLPEVKEKSPDTAVVMLTAAASLETALDCLRQGADDYLTKPVRFENLFNTLRRILEKRRLALRNRQYQQELEKARQRIERTHNLSIKMNGAYLRATDLNLLAQAILTGITAQEGLGFNRAFMLLLSEDGTQLKGSWAIGPINQEEGVVIWKQMQSEHLTLDDLLQRLRTTLPEETAITRLIKSVSLDAAANNNLAAAALSQRRMLLVQKGKAEYPVPPALLEILQEDSFVVAPLYSPERNLGVVIVDYFISHRDFELEKLHALESFLSQASLAIEHGYLYQAVQRQVRELEQITRELHKNKEMLVTAGRYSAVGHMTAQLAHNLRNPMTAIGGTARMLARKITDPDAQRFLRMMVDEVEKVEKTLANLAHYSETIQPVYETVSLSELAQNAVRLYQQDMALQGITVRYDCKPDAPLVEADPKLIQQVLVHLISNAIDAMPEGGTLTLRIRPEDGGLVVSIQDTGSGISAPILKNVTDPFFTTKTMGTGLGLSLVQRVIQDHGGTLALSNSAAGGAQARIWMPLTSSPV